MKKTTLFLIFSLCFISANSFSQERAGKIGMLIMGDPFKPNVDLGMTFWLNSTETLEPALGFASIDPDEGTTQTNLRLGLGWKHYFNQNEIAPYIGSRVAYNSLSGGGDSYSDLIIGAIFGVEYFLSK